MFLKRAGSCDLAQSCLETTRDLLKKVRYRIAGSPECRQAAHEIAGVRLGL
jgi:hypothetical protein